MNKRAYQWMGGILFAFLISTVAGQLTQIMAQNAADDFFDQGDRELDQDAETLEQPQTPKTKPLLTIEEEPSPTENTGALTSESLKNATYQIPNLGQVTLTNGTYQVSSGQSLSVTLSDVSALGDLSGEGSQDAAAILVVNRGESAASIYLAAVVDREGNSDNADTILLGKGVKVKTVSIEGGQINVDLLKHKPTDPICCPTDEIIQSYRLNPSTIETTPLPRFGWEVSQTPVIPIAASEPLANSPSANEPQTTPSQSNRWHFLFQPYLYLPVTIYGDANFGRFTGDIAIDGDQIRTSIKDDLNFAFLGDLQAWTPNYRVGLLADVNYLSASSQDTFTRSIRRPGLADFVPSELQAEVDTHVWYVNLGAAYRFYNQSQINPEGVSTEFDLGTFVFDIVGGLNIASVNADLDLSTNLGGQAEFDGGTTVVSPMLGGRLRVNASPKLALVTQGSVAGFGIGGLTQWGVLAGLDWMFSGNTSLGLGYRFGYVSYNKDFDRDKDFGVSLNQNGPYLSLGFRF